MVKQTQTIRRLLLTIGLSVFVQFWGWRLKNQFVQHLGLVLLYFNGKCVLKICSKFTGEHPCRKVISIKLLCNFIKTALRHGLSPLKLLHIFWTTFPTNTSERLLLKGEPEHEMSENKLRMLSSLHFST